MSRDCEDIPNLNPLEAREDVIYNVLVVDGKDLIITALRDWFAHDNIFTYRSDEHGYPLIPTSNLVNGGVVGSENVVWGENSTKIIITDDYRYESRFFPAITVTDSGGSGQDISFNQELSSVRYRDEEVVRGGEIVKRKVPSHVIFAGAWKQSYGVNIIAEDHSTRKRLKDVTALLMQNVLREQLISRGIFIEKVTFSGDREENYSNGYYYYSGVNLDLYSEWRREIPVTMLVEAITVSSNLLTAALSPEDLRILKDCIAGSPYAAFYSHRIVDYGYRTNGMKVRHEHGYDKQIEPDVSCKP